MVTYEFVCDECGNSYDLYGKMADGPRETPNCVQHGPMRRLYSGQPKSIVMLDMRGYVEKAYRGEEDVPSLHLWQVRGMVDAQYARRKAGRRNNARRQHTR